MMIAHTHFRDFDQSCWRAALHQLRPSPLARRAAPRRHERSGPGGSCHRALPQASRKRAASSVACIASALLTHTGEQSTRSRNYGIEESSSSMNSDELIRTYELYSQPVIAARALLR